MEEKNISNNTGNEALDENAVAVSVEESAEPAVQDSKTAVKEVEESNEAILIADEKTVESEDSSLKADESGTEVESLEEKQTEELVTDIPSAPPAAYAFRWDYSEQKKYDDGKKSSSGRSRGAVTYAIILTVTLLISLAALAGAILLGEALPEQNTPPMAFSDELALDSLYEYCLPSYVAISTITQSGTEGAGSGIVITEDGYISTNYHVVEKAKKITVITSDEKKYDAKYIDGDEVNDIAVLKISARGLKAATLGNSSDTKVGERVMAIGTPYSVSYKGSMTAGYISGVNRQYAVKNSNGTVNKILTLLQTDTSVNPGNSGGPLFNMNGEVIGVVTMKISGSNYEGMGFALPIDGVRGMIFDIIENGKITDGNAGSAVQGAALGISGHAVEGGRKYLITETSCYPVKTDDNGDYIEYQYSAYSSLTEKVYVSDADGLEDVGIVNPRPYKAPCTGVLVRSTSEGFDSADKLREDDVIHSANGIECETMSILQDIIFNSKIGDELELEVHRDGMYYNITVELGEANSMD